MSCLCILWVILFLLYSLLYVFRNLSVCVREMCVASKLCVVVGSVLVSVMEAVEEVLFVLGETCGLPWLCCCGGCHGGIVCWLLVDWLVVFVVYCGCGCGCCCICMCICWYVSL